MSADTRLPRFLRPSNAAGPYGESMASKRRRWKRDGLCRDCGAVPEDGGRRCKRCRVKVNHRASRTE